MSSYILDLAALLPFNRRLGGSRSQSQHFGGGINAISLLVVDLQSLCCPIYQLQYPGSFFTCLTKKCHLISSLFLSVFPDSKSAQVTHFSGP